MQIDFNMVRIHRTIYYVIHYVAEPPLSPYKLQYHVGSYPAMPLVINYFASLLNHQPRSSIPFH
jgi:hypothetical protein